MFMSNNAKITHTPDIPQQNSWRNGHNHGFLYKIILHQSLSGTLFHLSVCFSI